MSKANKDAQAIPVILDYLTKQNRPYSATDIHSNLHNAFGKTTVVKALESLSSDGKIKSKTYNKQIVYVTDQSKLPEVDEKELNSMDQLIASLSQNIKTLNEDCKKLEASLISFNSQITTEEAKNQVEELKKICDNLEKKLKTLKPSEEEGKEGGAQDNKITPEERDKLLLVNKKYKSELKKRKRICNDMIDAVLEGYPKSKMALIEEAGLDYE